MFTVDKGSNENLLLHHTKGCTEGRGLMTDDVVGFEHQHREFEKNLSVSRSDHV